MREYVYLEGERVAILDCTSGTMETIFLANNHIGQAQFAWDASSDPRFEHIQTPFGEGMIEKHGSADMRIRRVG